MIRRFGSCARLVLASACVVSLTACPSAAPEGDPDGSGGESASTGATGSTTSTGGMTTSSGGIPTSSASTASGQGGDGGDGGTTSTSSQSSAGGGEGGGPPGDGGGAGDGGGGGGTGGDGDTSSNGTGGEGGASCNGSEVRCDGACTDLTSDEDHCGTCDHGCLGGACVGSACQILVLDEPVRPGALALDDTHVWFIDEGTDSNDAYVMKAPKVPDVADPPDIFTPASYYSLSLALTDTYVVWADFSEDVITMSPRAAADPEVLTEELDAPEGMVAVGDEVFVAVSGNADRCIARITVGTSAVDPFPADPKGPSLVVADDTYLYYVDASFFADSTADIVRVGQNESGRTVLVTGDLAGTLDDTPVPTDLALHDGMLYFANARGLFRLAVDGGAPTTPERIVTTPVLRVAVDASGIYWFTASDNTLHLADHDGNEVRLLANGMVGHIALDDGAVYWTETRDSNTGYVKKLAK